MKLPKLHPTYQPFFRDAPPESNIKLQLKAVQAFQAPVHYMAPLDIFIPAVNALLDIIW